ncbi:uncharacterized protein LOC105156318 [Sesamum indicum]|uniref:Uncharacterized protein LOC105156318 n=1 Tax=Sesamum indicum TaxID=4182 RepID=A0A6I9SLG9_SESIN|nr:uncharacterized protein LOC105156318 [Sesamum indicum]
MLKHLPKWTSNPLTFLLPTPFLSCSPSGHAAVACCPPSVGRLQFKLERASRTPSRARRRVIYDEEEEEEDEEYGYNEEIAMLEMYTQSMKDEILLVQTWVDEEQVEVLIFKGFSSCLSYKTSADPSRSVVPSKAVIRSIDRIKGPFDPSNIHYIEKGLTFDAFKTRFHRPN